MNVHFQLGQTCQKMGNHVHAHIDLFILTWLRVKGQKENVPAGHVVCDDNMSTRHSFRQHVFFTCLPTFDIEQTWSW